MGLDQYLYVERPGESEPILVDTWRKSNPVQGFMDSIAIERGLIEPGDSINADTNLYLDQFDLITLATACEDVLEALGFDPANHASITDETLGINFEPMDPDDPNGLSLYREGPNEWHPTAGQVATAMDLLPTKSGFFFGSTDIDVWYVQDLTNTLRILDNLANMLEPGDKVFYTAWW